MNATLELLDEIDAYIASGRKTIRFPRAIENIFNEQRRRYRARAMRSSVWPSIVWYNIFIPIDFYLLPKTILLAIFLHAVITTWIVVAGLILQAEPKLILREMVCVSLPALFIAQILTIFSLNHASAASDYQYLSIMVVVYMNANVRPDFRFALIASLVLGGLYEFVLVEANAPVSTIFVGISSMVMAIYISLIANWRMERDARHAFVYGLQNRLRREAAEAEADLDALTGLFNRRHLESATARIWAESKRSRAVAVIMLDVDHFKAFNDRYGHPAGDQCLKSVAGAILTELSGGADIAVRFGGEEFLILLPTTGIGAALEIADRIRRGVVARAIPHEVTGSGGTVTVSLGVAAGETAFKTAAELISASDMALYAAKRNGRNQIWTQSVDQSAEASLDIMSQYKLVA